MNLLQNKTVKKLSKKELLQEYVFDKYFAERMLLSYLQAKTSHSLQDFLSYYVSDESIKENQRLVQEKLLEIQSKKKFVDLNVAFEEAARKERVSGENRESIERMMDIYVALYEAGREEIMSSKENLEIDTQMEEINKRSNVSYDIDGFFKIDGILYYLADDIAYNLGDLPFECVVVCSVYYSLKNNDNTTNFLWTCAFRAFDFLVDPTFHKELLELLKKGGLMQKNREQMLYGFLEALQRDERCNRRSNTPQMYNFDILFAFLQLITIDDQKAHELAQNCVSTMSFQGVINYLSLL